MTSGGAETLVANLSEEYSRAGHESLVVALCDAAALGNTPAAEARLKAQIEASGGRFESLNLPAGRPLLAGSFRLRRVLRDFMPDVIHAHTARALLMMMAKGIATGAVLTHHNSVLCFSPVMFRLFDRIVDGYVAISHGTREILDRNCRRPVTSIANAPGKGFALAAPRTRSGSPLQVLSVGAISEQKNYPLLVETARALRDGGMVSPLPIFTIAGTGAQLEHLRTQVAAARLQNNVRFVGERNDVATLMRDADLYLNTSRYEGMPIALLEAMAMALPIVATDVAGNCELVASGSNGLLAAPSAVRLAEAITHIASDHQLYATLSAGALDSAREYSISSVASRHLALYQNLVRSTGNQSNLGDTESGIVTTTANA
nr:glycosyltransferase family 4 protein [Novosphingobium hassiacum]